MVSSLEPWQPPRGAVRDAELEAWEVSERDLDGVRHGECTLYRDDGSLLLRCRYEAGKRNGTFTSYHRNGDVESEGTYVDGMLDGSYVRYTSDGPGSKPLRACCVPPGARELHVTFQRGTELAETFYDAGGRALRSDGTYLPPRAAGVPDTASFDESEERWVERVGSDDGVLLRRSIDLDGRLVEEAEIRRGRRVRLSEYYAASGGLSRELHFDESGVVHGPFRIRFDAERVPYAERTIREVTGAFEQGQAVGTFRFLDGEGRELRTQERGEALSDERLWALIGPEPIVESAGVLWQRAESLVSERRTREGLFWAARAAARAGGGATLRDFLAKTIVPLEGGVAAARAAALDREARPTIRQAFDALLDGADAAEILRLLATLFPAEGAAGTDLVVASLLLAPKNPRALVTRALLRLEHGNVPGALEDVSGLAEELAPAAKHVSELASVLFRKLSFGPALDPPPAPSDQVGPVGVEQPLEAVRRAIAVYATRLSATREELRRRLGEQDWLPPDTSELLEDGPVELRRYTATITDEDEDGSETSEVTVDETLDLAGSSAATLMTVARADFDALSWLCWSAGLDELALPAALAPRASFVAAIDDAIHRLFRIRDQLSTGGLVSRARGVSDFVWDGHDVGTLSIRFAEIAARQFLERRAMFFFLLFPQNLSPFQSDLRQA
jgi:antitoxin component YwqK of YwqJK toxin-antitoxin module